MDGARGDVQPPGDGVGGEPFRQHLEHGQLALGQPVPARVDQADDRREGVRAAVAFGLGQHRREGGGHGVRVVGEHEDDRGARAAADQVVEQGQRTLVGAVHVVEQEHRPVGPGHRVERRAHGAVVVVPARPPRFGQRPEQTAQHQVRVLLHRRERLRRGGRAVEGVGEQPVRHGPLRRPAAHHRQLVRVRQQRVRVERARAREVRAPRHRHHVDAGSVVVRDQGREPVRVGVDRSTGGLVPVVDRDAHPSPPSSSWKGVPPGKERPDG